MRRAGRACLEAAGNEQPLTQLAAVKSWIIERADLEGGSAGAIAEYSNRPVEIVHAATCRQVLRPITRRVADEDIAACLVSRCGRGPEPSGRSDYWRWRKAFSR